MICAEPVKKLFDFDKDKSADADVVTESERLLDRINVIDIVGVCVDDALISLDSVLEGVITMLRELLRTLEGEEVGV